MLELKQHLEKKQQQELTILLNKLYSEERKLENIINERESYWMKQQNTKGHSMLTSEISLIINYTNFLKNEIAFQKSVLINMADEVKKKQKELQEILKDRKILEKLKENKLEEYKKDLHAEEQKFLDELAIRSHASELII